MAQRMTTDQILDTIQRFHQQQERKMSQTPTWDKIEHHTSQSDQPAYLLTRAEFNSLRNEAKALRNQQTYDEAIEFFQKAGTTFGSAVVKALGPLLGSK